MATTGYVNWGILGPGRIAGDFLAGARGSATGRVVAVGARRPDDPALTARFPGCRVHAGYEALIAAAEVDAIYVATPHPFHAEWAIAAARAGKHVLCEKPVAMSAHEAARMFDAARRAGTFMGEAFMYRLHPLTARLLSLIDAGTIGEVRVIRSSFGFAARVDPAGRLFAPALGGGAILDVGGYPVSMARLIAGRALGRAFAEPERMAGVAHIGATGVDERAVLSARFPGGILADLACSITARLDNVLHVAGTEGRLEVDQFWFAGGKGGGTSHVRLVRPDGAVETFPVEEPRNLYSFQFEAANEAIRAGRGEFASPGMSAADSIGNMRVLDGWLADARRE